MVQLREVFNARGVTRSDGSLRQWTNGNLQVLLEPTDHGHRLRFGTMNSAARASIGVGLVAFGMTLFMTISAIIAGNLGSALPGIGLIGVMSAAPARQKCAPAPGLGPAPRPTDGSACRADRASAEPGLAGKPAAR